MKLGLMTAGYTSLIKHPSAEAKAGPVAVTSCTSVCSQCRQEARVHRRTHALGLETTYRVVAAFCTAFLR